MNKIKAAIVATAAIFLFACGSKTEADFSIIPIMGSNGEYQYIDIAQKGKIVINPQFEQAHIFRDGLALVKTAGSEGNWGYIDKKGKFAISPVYSKAQDFSEGVAWVQLEDQPPALIDKKGKVVLQMDSLIAASPFHDGIAGIKVWSQNQILTLFIDKKGNSVAETMPGEEIIPLINDGLYAFKNGDEKWGYKNKKGEIVINPQFDNTLYFVDGMSVISMGDKWGAIDKKGEIIINTLYDALEYDSDNLFIAKLGKKYGWINKKGETVINPQFDFANGFNGSKFAAVQMGSKWAYIDREGTIAINPQFDRAFPFSGDYAMVRNTDDRKDKAGFINKEGSFIVPALYDIDIRMYVEYLFAVGQNNYGFSTSYDEDFDMYSRLKEKKEEDSIRAIAAAEEERKRAIAVASGTFTDSRDNKIYKTIKIGSQTWMAENLNYQGDGYLGLCYGDKPREQIRKPENCDKYGRLYDWSEAMGLDSEFNKKKFSNSEERVQGVCPEGWHLPSYDEWNGLMLFVGGEYIAGKRLRAREGWDNNSNGTDDYGFAALPGGEGSSNFTYRSMGRFVYWWSATESNTSSARTLNMDNNSVRLRPDSDYKTTLSYIRCIRDDSKTIKTNTVNAGNAMEPGLQFPDEPANYVLQVTSAPSAEEANAFMRKLANAGIRAYAIQVENPGNQIGTFHRVRIGNFGTKEAANNYGESVLKPKGFDYFLDKKEQ